MKKLIFAFAFLLVSFCSITAVAVTTTYQFLPDPNTLRTSGGVSGQGQGSRSIEGQFRLTVNFNAGTASFDQVDAILSREIEFFDYNEGFIPTDSLNVLFHMTELVSTDANETAIRFDLRRNNPTFPAADILIVVTYMNNCVRLTGCFCEAMYDGFCYHLDAVALPLPKTYYVDAANGDDNNDGLSPETAFATIQKGIDVSNNGDTIEVQPGKYVENINFCGKNITLTSTDPTNKDIINSTIIDGNNANSVVTFSGTEDSNCVLTGFTITNGQAANGGGIYGNGTMAKIQNNIISGNLVEASVAWGGGICNCNGTIQDNTISENSVIGKFYGTGGGLYECHGTIQDNLVVDNSSTATGGPYSGSGGGLADCDGIIQNNTIKGNSAGDGAGLIGCDGTIRNNVISSNFTTRANGHGGGLYQCHGIIQNNVICENSAQGWGGGIYYSYGAIIQNNTICGNSGSYGGGLSRCIYGNTVILNCILWGNTCTQDGAQIYHSEPPYFSCIEGWTGGGLGNISAAPLFADPCKGDYHLQSQAGRWDPNNQSWVTDANTSPCIDAGDPSSDWTAELWPHGKRINMGAYGGTHQASMSLSNAGNIADLNNDGFVDCNDMKLLTEKWLNNQVLLPEDLDRNGFVDFADFAIFAQQWPVPFALEPRITYQIEDCNQGASGSFSSQSGQTRFTAIVEDRYIRFQDMMVANCCADKLELEMIVEDNLIVIHEIEHLTHPCLCICDYPVTAMLGPFEPGTYTLEVYEDYGGFIGSTVVTIGAAQ